MTMISGHELVKTHLCTDPSCEDDGEVEVGGAWYCAHHVPARRNGSQRAAKGADLRSATRAAASDAAKGAEPEPETTPVPAVAAAEREPEEPQKCSKCDEPGVTRYGKAMLCEAHDLERREKTRRTLRKRNDQLKLTSSPPLPGGLVGTARSHAARPRRGAAELRERPRNLAPGARRGALVRRADVGAVQARS